VPHRDRLVILPVEAVVSIEVQDGITRIYALHDERDARAPLRQYLVPHTLEHLEAHLDPDNFLRVHRSALVQLRHIREMVPWFSGRYKLIMTEGHEVIASRERSRVLRDRLML
jgi:two-component system, LytTR family, response regulator